MRRKKMSVVENYQNVLKQKKLNSLRQAIGKLIIRNVEIVVCRHMYR